MQMITLEDPIDCVIKYAKGGMSHDPHLVVGQKGGSYFSGVCFSRMRTPTKKNTPKKRATPKRSERTRGSCCVPSNVSAERGLPTPLKLKVRERFSCFLEKPYQVHSGFTDIFSINVTLRPAKAIARPSAHIVPVVLHPHDLPLYFCEFYKQFCDWQLIFRGINSGSELLYTSRV